MSGESYVWRGADTHARLAWYANYGWQRRFVITLLANSKPEEEAFLSSPLPLAPAMLVLRPKQTRLPSPDGCHCLANSSLSSRRAQTSGTKIQCKDNRQTHISSNKARTTHGPVVEYCVAFFSADQQRLVSQSLWFLGNSSTRCLSLESSLQRSSHIRLLKTGIQYIPMTAMEILLSGVNGHPSNV